jgi:membrane carboxypeptidase/penicillin-binding protein
MRETEHMPSVMNILIARRRRGHRSRGAFHLGLLALAAVAAICVYFGFMLLSAGRRYALISGTVPPAGLIESQFANDGEEDALTTTRLFDRTGQHVLSELIHPLAKGRRWYSLDPAGEFTAPQSLVDAVLAFHDPGYWEAGGRLAVIRLREAVARLPVGRGISQQLAAGVIGLNGQPLKDPAEAYIQASILATQLEAKYSKERLLEWYLNSAYFGNLAYGIDAGALVYFGKHASELSLAESALLAPIPSAPDLNPIDAPEAAKLRQVWTLMAMVMGGRITQAQANQALAEHMDLRSADAVRQGLNASAFERYVSNNLRESLGPDFIRWSGYRVKTSLDVELQSQAECGSEYFLRRAQGELPEVEASAAAGACSLIDLLPPLRPGDIEGQHHIDEAAAVVLDAASGQVLAMVDHQASPAWVGEAQVQASVPRPGGDMLLPFVYLTAFSRGYSPASMVLDVPSPGRSALVDESPEANIAWEQFHGPTSMRRALANAYPAAAANAMQMVGEEHVLRTLRQIGFRSFSQNAAFGGEAVTSGEAEIALLDLAYAHAVLANTGHMAGEVAMEESGVPDSSPSLGPVSVLRVVGPAGQEILSHTQAERAVVSPQLAYLVTDVLADPEARQPSTGSGVGVDIERPAAFYAAVGPQLENDWAVGYTPGMVAAVWLEDLAGEGAPGSSAALRASALSDALLAYAVRETPIQDWEIPPGITVIEVCVPSGLLPTEYCPEISKEPFIQGTEPTAFDNLYRPFLVDTETGNLATLFTPLDLVEERVYMIPPPEASAWARSAGIEAPPQEYDAYIEDLAADPELAITSPAPFSFLRGWVWVRGDVRVDPLSYFRLQYGPGLNPTRWIQIGADQRMPVVGGPLGLWDARDLDGLYTLQLVAVLEGGRVRMDAVPVTIDNRPPAIRLLAPEQGAVFSLQGDLELVIQAQVTDSVALSRVEFYADGRRIEVRDREPFSAHWDPQEAGEVVVFVRAFDEAGNLAESERRTVMVIP